MKTKTKEEYRRWLYGIWNRFENQIQSPDKRVGSNEFFAEWFIRRFCTDDHKPTDDYAQVWVSRFKTGTPWNAMDGESLKIFRTMINDEKTWFGTDDHDTTKTTDLIIGHKWVDLMRLVKNGHLDIETLRNGFETLDKIRHHQKKGNTMILYPDGELSIKPSTKKDRIPDFPNVQTNNQDDQEVR